jgi:hypothetical protein
MTKLATAGLSVSIGFALNFTTAAFASPSTSDYLNALTVCGLGIKLNIDADLAGSVKTIYDGAETKGKGFLSVEPALKNIIAAAVGSGTSDTLINQYLGCIKETLSLK